ncbi:unnamed protein product [Sphagnum compactum]
MAGLEDVAGVLGVSVPVVRFLLCFLASIPCSWLARFTPAGALRNLYAAGTGALLSYYAFGAEANFLFFVPILVSYGSMLVYRRRCGVITFFIAFAFLIACHMLMMSGDAWKNGGIDSTGALMVLTLKVISAAVCYQDGRPEKQDDLRESQKKNQIRDLPSPITFLGYCLNCGTHLAGPVYEIKDYIDWAENRGLWDPRADQSPPLPYKAAGLAMIQALICMTIYLYLLPRVPLSKFSSPEYQKWGLVDRLGFMYISGFTARWKYYFIWSISQVAMIISGLGFSGWCTTASSSEPTPDWTRAKNVDIVKVELAKSGVELPMYWNISVSTWLRHYVYERLVPKGGKAGFAQLLSTQVTSAVWHGLYFGYFLYFIHSALMIAGSRVLYRWQSAIPPSFVWARRLGHLINGLFTALVNNYACIGFLLLSRRDTLDAYSSVYYLGTVVPAAIILFGSLVKPPRVPSKSKPKKEN